MSVSQFVKKNLVEMLESSQKLESIFNSKLGEKVLIVGDGISAAYAINDFKNYDNIIVCNNAIQNKYLEGHNVLFHIIMEPHLLIRSRHKEMRDIFRKAINRFSKTDIILNPFGRLFNLFTTRYKDPIYLSPYKKLSIDDKVIYDDFTAAFQATLGTALWCGFKEIHCVGFDAWLLTPKNNLRWYSNSVDPFSKDVIAGRHPEPFLLKATSLAKIKVMVFEHYSSRFDFIEEIEVDRPSISYIPAEDRENLMYEDFKNYMLAWENKYYPGGYLGETTS
jgi:hypothetical protein